MKNWGLTKRFLILWQIPPIVIALVIGGYLTHSYLKEVEDLILERGISDARQWSDLLGQAVDLHNRELSQQIANTLLETKGIRAVRIVNSTQTLMIAAGPDMLPATTRVTLQDQKDYDVLRGDRTIRFRHAIPDQPVLSWIEIEYSLERYNAGAHRAVLGSITLTTILLLIMALLAIRRTAFIRKSFQAIGAALDSLQNGDLDCEIHIDSAPELNRLAAQINEARAGLKAQQIEAQRDTERVTRDLRETLETIEIQNIELDLARKEAQEAERIKARFLANTSHEIRTPLNSIIGFTNLLLKTPNGDHQEEYLTTIKHSAEGLLAIINDILDFSKIEAGKLILDHSSIHLRTVAEKSLAALAPHAEEKNLALNLLIEPHIPQAVMGDALRIQQILTNLISNAIKFTHEGHVLVLITQQERRDQSVQLKFTVADTGIGLTVQQQGMLFQAFSQADHFSTEVPRGTGLGLAITKHLVQQMGGDIGVSSEPGRGSEFWFSIHCQIADYDPPVDLHDKTIALVALQEPAGMALQYLLESWFIAVRRCQSLAEAAGSGCDAMIVDLKDAANPDEILADIKARDSIMPAIVLLPFFADETLKHTLRDAHITPLRAVADHRKVYSALNQLLGTTKPQAARDQSDAPQTRTPSGNVPKILAVDDNPANLRLLTIVLEEAGMEVVQAINGLDAVEKTRKQIFDLIFMDIRMPGINGLEATQAIRSQQTANRDTPIIALTAHALEEERRILLRTGMNDHLIKPISEEQIRSCIVRWCPGISGIIKDNGQVVAQESTATGCSQMPVDVPLCLKRVNNRGALAREMLLGVLQELETNQDAINNAYRSGNHPELLDRIHRLHGVCCCSGVPDLERITRSIEEALKKSQLDLLDGKMSELTQQISLLQKWQIEYDIELLFEDP